MADVRGDIELTDDDVLVIRRIHVTYHLKADREKKDVIERCLEFHVRKCPVARSIGGSIDITTELDLLEE